MIRAALRDELPGHDVVIVPFPLDRPEVWFDYIPADTHQFVRAFSPWERSKADTLSSGGYDVTLLEGDPHTVVRASAIRSRWHDLEAVLGDLPEAIVHQVEQVSRARPEQVSCEATR